MQTGFLASATALLVLLATSLQAAPSLDAALSAIRTEVRKSDLPGMVVAITDRERLVAVIVNGYADLKLRTPLTAETPFAIGSISKSFTAIALLQLSDEGRIDLDAPVTRYLPWFKVNSRFAPITSHHLLTHTAGLPNYLADLASSRAALLALRDFAPAYPPGAHFWYSNTGYQALGYVLEGIEKAPYAQILRRRVLMPLHMQASEPAMDDAQRRALPVSYQKWPYDGSYVEVPWFEYTAADGSITSSASDMSAYVRMLLNRGKLGASRLLSEQAFRRLTTPVLEHYAYGFDVYEEAAEHIVAHDGGIGGFVSRIEAHMDQGFGLVFLGNGGLSRKLEHWIAATVSAAYRGEALPAPPLPDAQASADAARFAGTYRSAQGNAVSFMAAGSVLQLAGEPLITMGKGTYRFAGERGDALPFIFGAQSEEPDARIVEVSHGAEWYARSDFHPPTQAMPEIYRAYVGHYVNHGPEGPTARVFIRRGTLMLSQGNDAQAGLAQALVPLAPGEFRPATPDFNPERLRFDSLIEGQALRLTMSGSPMYRIETP